MKAKLNVDMYIDTLNKLFIPDPETPIEPNYIEKEEQEFRRPEVPVIKPVKPSGSIPETLPLKIR